MKIPEEVLLWKFGAKSGNLKSENHYINNEGFSLYCKTVKKFLIWKQGMIGINLAYSSATQNKVHFHLPDNKERDILTGEPVSLAIGMGEAFLRYGKQRVGINLRWTSEPGDEWRIYDESGEKGKTIVTGKYYALANIKVKPDPDFLVHLEKHMPKVVDLGWTTSPTWKESWIHAFKALNDIRKEII